MADEIASLYATIGADTSGFESALGRVSSALGGLGGMLSGLSFIGLFGAAVGAASDAQSSYAQLDAVLKSTTTTLGQAADTQGHWATTTEASGPKADKLRNNLEMLTAQLSDHQAALRKAHGPHAALQATIDQEQEKIAKLTAELGINTAGQKVWVAGTSQMADASHMSRDALISMASSLEGTTRFSKESVIGAESMLLTFKEIGADVFPNATKTALDMSQALGQDLKSSSIQLGKALNDPVKGVSALARVGVTFSDTQKEQIKHFVATNQLAKAQGVILDELNSEFGGSAVAAGQTFAGSLDRLKNTFGELLEKIGNYILPVLQSFANGLIDVVTTIGAAGPSLDSLIAVVLAVGVGLFAIPAILGVLGVALGAILSPIGLIVIGVIAFKTAFDNNFGGVRDTVLSAWNAIVPTLEKFKQIGSDFMKSLFPDQSATPQGTQVPTSSNRRRGGQQSQDEDPQAGPMKTVGQASTLTFGDKLIAGIQDALPKVQAALGGLIASVGTWITSTGWPLFTSKLAGLFGIDPNIFDTIKNVFGSVWNDTVKPIIDSLQSGITGFIDKLKGADFSGVAKLLVVIGGALALFGLLVGTVAGGALKGIAGALGPLGDALKGLINALADAGNGNFSKALSDIGGALKDLASGFLKIPAGIAESLGNLLHIDVKAGIKSWDDMAGALPDTLSKIFGSEGAIAVAINGFKKDTWDVIFGDKGTLALAFDKAKDWVKPLISAIDSIATGIAKAFSGVLEIMTAPFMKGIDFIGQMLMKAKDLPVVGTDLYNVGVGLVGIASKDAMGPPAPAKAVGGPVAGNSPYTVGEHGTELFIPSVSGNIIPNDVLKASHSKGGGGRQVTVSGTINVYGVQDAESLLDQLEGIAGLRNMSLRSAM